MRGGAVVPMVPLSFLNVCKMYVEKGLGVEEKQVREAVNSRHV